jgi:hypothetical protein
MKKHPEEIEYMNDDDLDILAISKYNLKLYLRHKMSQTKSCLKNMSFIIDW